MLKFNELSKTQQYRRKKKAEQMGCSVEETGDNRGRHHNHVRGNQHYRWNDNIVSSHGYIKVRVGKNHHLADPNGYAYKHQLVAEDILGRPLLDNETVHHINKIKCDNRPENIKIMTKSQHSRLEMETRSRDKYGRLISNEGQ